MSYDQRGLAGVRGWLAFFVVTLVLSALTSLVVPLVTKGTALPIMTMRAGWSTYLAVLWGISLLRTAGFTYLAWLLNARQVASTPRRVIAGLWLLAIVPLLLDYAALVALLRIDPAAVAGAFGAQFVRPALYAMLWTLYLLRSRRVAATYVDDDRETEALGAVFE